MKKQNDNKKNGTNDSKNLAAFRANALSWVMAEALSRLYAERPPLRQKSPLQAA